MGIGGQNVVDADPVFAIQKPLPRSMEKARFSVTPFHVFTLE
jgi:hypothetical protein